jgi:hypothetical protein
MGSIVKWAKFGNWSGPYIKGTVPYILPTNPTGFDVIVAAVAKPEGGDYDTFVAYDGTAVTYGLLQWTFTSGRLHKLLIATVKAMGVKAFADLFSIQLSKLTGLSVDPGTGSLLLRGVLVTDFFSLRDVCTPPGGKCPKTGPNWEKAKAIALLFSKLGENPIAQKAQIDFFRQELDHEKDLKRPKLHGGTIADYLYRPEMAETPYLIASRALFWGMWQNAPREAEADKPIPGVARRAGKSMAAPVVDPFDEILGLLPEPVQPRNPRSKVLGATKGYDLSTREGLEVLAKGFARSNFGNWGVAKAKANGRTSRYQKVATAINTAMCGKIVPEYWR